MKLCANISVYKETGSDKDLSNLQNCR